MYPLKSNNTGERVSKKTPSSRTEVSFSLRSMMIMVMMIRMMLDSLI